MPRAYNPGVDRVLFVIALAAAACGRTRFSERPDAPADTEAPACTGFDLCDGFEAPAIDTSVWMLDPLVTRDTTVAHRGAASVHMHTDAFPMGTMSYQMMGENRVVPGGTLWARLWVRLVGLPAGTNGMELISAVQTAGAMGDYVFIHNYAATLYTQFAGPARDTSTPPPANTWFCIVLQLVRDTGTAGSLALTSDVLAPISIPSVQTDAAPPISVLYFGLGFATTNTKVDQPAVDVWIDDVIVHSAPVTCAD